MLRMLRPINAVSAGELKKIVPKFGNALILILHGIDMDQLID